MSIELTFSLISSMLREYHQIFNSLRMIVKLATVKGPRHAAMLLNSTNQIRPWHAFPYRIFTSNILKIDHHTHACIRHPIVISI